MKQQITSLLLAVLPLFTPSFGNDYTLSTEFSSTETFCTSTPCSSQSCQELLFLSKDVLWSVNQQTGTITALDPGNLFPLWSSSGMVYRAVPVIFPNFPLSFNAPPCQNSPIFDSKIECAEIHGRVYFHLSELRDSFYCSNKPGTLNEYEDCLLAFDSTSQGKLLWKLNINELKQILKIPSNVASRFVGVPLQGNGNLLIISLLTDLTDSPMIILILDSSSGVLIRD